MTDMERKQYQDQIKELIQTVKTLLDANVTLGEKQKEAEESSDEESEPASEATNPKGDLSKRPDHCNTMQAETCVVYECDLEKVKAMGLTFLRYTRPVDQRSCKFVDESKYNMPTVVPHTSGTSAMVSDLAVNRFQYAITSGREIYRIINEKMKMSKMSI